MRNGREFYLVLFWCFLSNHTRKAGVAEVQGPVYIQSFTGEVASFTPDFPRAGEILDAWQLVAVADLPFVSTATPEGMEEDG